MARCDQELPLEATASLFPVLLRHHHIVVKRRVVITYTHKHTLYRHIWNRLDVKSRSLAQKHTWEKSRKELSLRACSFKHFFLLFYLCVTCNWLLPTLGRWPAGRVEFAGVVFLEHDHTRDSKSRYLGVCCFDFYHPFSSFSEVSQFYGVPLLTLDIWEISTLKSSRTQQEPFLTIFTIFYILQSSVVCSLSMCSNLTLCDMICHYLIKNK